MTPEDEELIARIPSSRRDANAIPDAARSDLQRRAVARIREVLGPRLRSNGIRISPLGPGWSRDVDVYLHDLPRSEDLQGSGWLQLDGLIHRLGASASDTWAVVEGGEVLAVADLHAGVPPDELASLLARCRRRGEVRLREVLELRALIRAGVTLPDHGIVTVAARVEAGLGGSLLHRWASGPPLVSPARLSPRWPRAALGRWRKLLRPRLVVAVSGVDGAGKSTLIRAVAGELRKASLPVGTVWTRPGIGLGWLAAVARVVKRVMRQDLRPGVQRVARGDDEGHRPLASRGGVVGWVWALLTTMAYVVNVWRQHLQAQGVVLYDRHLLDALVTLDFVYEGVDLRLQEALVRALVPKAYLSVYVDIPPSLAVARKPGAVFGEYAVQRQLELYADRLRQLRPSLVLDGTRASHELAAQVLERLLAS